MDYMGAFACSIHGGTELGAKFRKEDDPYNSIMAEALSDRLAEAFAEMLHKRARDEWGYGKAETLTMEQVIREKYRGIRPAPGYPACPDHTEKRELFRLLGAEQAAGMQLTESCAMLPASAVSGWYFAHPESKYIAIGKIERDQVEDYAKRKGMDVKVMEKWLGPGLGYEA